MNIEVSKRILQKGKALAPDRFPQPSLEVAQAWAEVLATVPLPWQVWSDAVTVWATELVGDRMCTPRDLRKAAYVVRDRWDLDPERRKILDAHRLERLNANYARMGLEPVDSLTPLASTETGEQPGDGQLIQNLRRRAQNAIKGDNDNA